jgi:hypothetical protein
MALGAERAQDRHHRRDPAAAADQEDPCRASIGESEIPVGRGQPEDHAGMRVLDQVVGDETLRMGLDGDLELASGARRR